MKPTTFVGCMFRYFNDLCQWCVLMIVSLFECNHQVLLNIEKNTVLFYLRLSNIRDKSIYFYVYLSLKASFVPPRGAVFFYVNIPIYLFFIFFYTQKCNYITWCSGPKVIRTYISMIYFYLVILMFVSKKFVTKYKH